MKHLQDAPRRAQEAARRPQDVPLRSQDAPKTPPDGPGAPQDAPTGGPARARSGTKLGSKSYLQRNPLQTSIFERLGVDVEGFGEVLSSIFREYTGDRTRAQGSLNLAARCRPHRRANEPRSDVANCSRSRAQGSFNLLKRRRSLQTLSS